MNLDQVLGSVRAILALVSGYALGKGWADADTITLVSGVIVAVIPLVWSYVAHTQQAKIASVEAMPNVAKIVTTDQKTADASGPKVVSTIDEAVAGVR